VYIDGVKDWDMKHHSLMGGRRSINEALNQALKLCTEDVSQTIGQAAALSVET
jgi:hypothetical protein